jgi:hypothetical protein
MCVCLCVHSAIGMAVCAGVNSLFRRLLMRNSKVKPTAAKGTPKDVEAPAAR